MLIGLGALIFFPAGLEQADMIKATITIKTLYNLNLSPEKLILLLIKAKSWPDDYLLFIRVL